MPGLFSALSLESLPLLSQVLMLGLTIVTCVLVYYLIQPWWRQRQQAIPRINQGTPGSVTVTRRPLIPASEVAVFNLLYLVSRDMFLVFAKVPLRTLVHIQSSDESHRREMAKAIRTVTVDYVLIHPGTMLPEKIIMIGVGADGGTQPQSMRELMTELCHEAGIEVIDLEAHKNYSVTELSGLLGLTEDE